MDQNPVIQWVDKLMGRASPVGWVRGWAATHRAVRERDVDGEVCVDEAHLVEEALGHARDEVLDVGAYRADGRQLLAVAEPEVHAQLLGVGALVLVPAHQLERQVQVLEAALQLAAGALHLDVAGLDLQGHCVDWGGVWGGEQEGSIT
jgi:hypothetical protein